MSPTASLKNRPTPEDRHLDGLPKSTSWLAKIHPYFRDPRNVLLLKLDTLLLSWAFVAGLFKDMDQSATTAAYVSGMKEDLELFGNELVEFTTWFSVGYALFIVPSQLIQTRVRPSIFLPICEIVWGLFTLVTYKATNAKTIYALRFFLGVFESTSWPGIVSLILNWYTPKELGKRLAIFGVSGVAGNMFLGIVQAALYKNLNGVRGLAGWQWLFVISGIMTIFWGIVGFFVIPDSPAITRALYLSEEERELSRTRMSDSGTKTSSLIPFKVLVQKLKLLVKSPITYLYLAGYLQFAWSQRANAYFLLYLKGLTKSNGDPLYSVYTVNLIPLGGYAISIVCNIGLNALSDWKGWRWQVAVAVATLQLLATSVLAGWPDSRQTIMAFYFLTFATAAWGYALLAWMAEILRKEPEIRSILVGLAVTLVYVGHATIPLRAWRVSDSPRYPIGFPLAAAFAAGSIIAILGLRLYITKYPDILDWGLDRDEAEARAVEETIPGDESVDGDDTKEPGQQKVRV
ncbi:major facilitator superfamily domain-containing protein [Dactylonectria macrodidyma]|uniref:Major facilitator superfamily domain-containing protein n=1 Tax=Dactylonectria macrodidyma TaxID=307937 RepID=A0A9P9FSG1_9HYPO|nr:major facilitator superfamily domain-containing protein [Dactylonectria macrodidyma]